MDYMEESKENASFDFFLRYCFCSDKLKYKRIPVIVTPLFQCGS